MDRSKPILALGTMLILIGASTLMHFTQKLFDSSENVRAVRVIGMNGGGVTCGRRWSAKSLASYSQKKEY
jgi:hypothetical protein